MEKTREEKIEMMAQEIIRFLEKKKYWNDNCGLVYNGMKVGQNERKLTSENLKGVMRIWYEGPLARAIDSDAKIFGGLEKIMKKYGYYPVPYSYCDLNVYDL